MLGRDDALRPVDLAGLRLLAQLVGPVQAPLSEPDELLHDDLVPLRVAEPLHEVHDAGEVRHLAPEELQVVVAGSGQLCVGHRA
eukprot:2016410-Alexandrium_andersonii.AAC.1